MSANSLLGGVTPNVIPNLPSTNPLYNPSIPVMGDQTVKSLRNIKMKDRFYLDNALDGQMKNNDGLSLGPNNKFLRRNDYDRQIDPNYLRRENPRNKKHTDPDDFYNGSALGYYEIPRRIPRAQIPNPLTSVDPMDMYQYANRFISNAVIAQPKASTTQPVFDINAPKRPRPVNTLADTKTIGQDPTTDPNIIKMNEELKKQMDQSIIDRAREINKRPPDNINTDLYDKYGKPTGKKQVKLINADE